MGGACGHIHRNGTCRHEPNMSHAPRLFCSGAFGWRRPCPCSSRYWLIHTPPRHDLRPPCNRYKIAIPLSCSAKSHEPWPWFCTKPFVTTHVHLCNTTSSGDRWASTLGRPHPSEVQDGHRTFHRTLNSSHLPESPSVWRHGQSNLIVMGTAHQIPLENITQIPR